MKKYKDGYVAIISVLIIGALVIAVAITISLLSIGEGQSSLSLTSGEDSLQLAEGCMEDALLKIRANSAYAGGTITRPDGTSCSVTVSQSGADYTVTAQTTGTKHVRKIQAVVNRGASITLTSWKETQ